MFQQTKMHLISQSTKLCDSVFMPWKRWRDRLHCLVCLLWSWWPRLYAMEAVEGQFTVVRLFVCFMIVLLEIYSLTPSSPVKGFKFKPMPCIYGPCVVRFFSLSHFQGNFWSHQKELITFTSDKTTETWTPTSFMPSYFI